MGIVRELFRSVRLQKQQLFFWLFLILFASGLVFLVRHSQDLFAAVPEIEENITGLVDSRHVDVAISKTGEVTVAGAKANKLFRPLPGMDEFKYKVLDRPETFIDQLTVRVIFESALPAGTKLRSFAIHGTNPPSQQQLDDHTLEFQVTGIGPEAAYTVNAQLPSGSIDWPFSRQLASAILGIPPLVWITLAAALPVIAFAVLLVMFWPRIKWFYTTAPSGASSELPKALPPALVGIIVNGRVSSREIAATLLDLATRGYLTVFNKGSGKFSFAKRKAWQDLHSFELLLLTQLFDSLPGGRSLPARQAGKSEPSQSYKASSQDIQVSLGTSLFSSKIAKIYLAMYDAATAEGYFEENPAALHRRYRFIGLVLFFLGLLAFTGSLILELEPSFVLFFFAGLMTMALVIIFAASSVPLYTKEGEAARLAWLRFRNYLRLEEPVGYVEGAQALYQRYLAYAVALKVEIPWAARFRHHPFNLPDWYDSIEQSVAIEDFANGLYAIVGSIGELFSGAKEPTVQ